MTSPESWILSGRYRIGDRLGSGGTAEVHRAHDELLDRDVAIKVFRDHPADDDELSCSARRETELQSLAQLNHPNLIRLLDGSINPGEPAYLVLDLVDGPDLATRLHDGPLPEDEVRAIGAQIAAALDYAHGMGIVHRDVKPANILLGADGPDGGVWARLSDFGTVRMVDRTRLTAADLTVGTASYIAPEQARGSDVGPPADVYSLGLVLIEALTGQRCFEGTTYEAVAARMAETPDIPDWVPSDLIALLTAMTAVEPDRRPTAAVVAECLPAVVAPEAAAAVDVAAVDAEDATTTLGTEQLAALAAVDLVDEPDEDDLASEPTRVRHRGGVLVALAAVAFAAMVSGAAVLLMDNSASGDSPTPNGPLRVVQPTQSRDHTRTTEAGAEVGTQPSLTSTHSSTHAPAPVGPAARTTSQTSSIRPAPTTSAPPPSSSATTSAPPPPTTSAPPTTSPAQSSSPAAAPTSAAVRS